MRRKHLVAAVVIDFREAPPPLPVRRKAKIALGPKFGTKCADTRRNGPAQN